MNIMANTVGDMADITTYNNSLFTSTPTSTFTSTIIPLSSSEDNLVLTKLNFLIDGKVIDFQGSEISRLKEMLNVYIKENHPEDLL